MLRLPDFNREEDLEWAKETASKKKKIDCSKAQFMSIEEGLCVQILHKGPFDEEPASVVKMDAYLKEQGYVNDLQPGSAQFYCVFAFFPALQRYMILHCKNRLLYTKEFVPG